MASAAASPSVGSPMNPILSPMYSRELPPIEEVEQYTLPDLRAFVRHTEDEVGLIGEECRTFSKYLQQMKDREQAAAAASGAAKDDDDGIDDPHAPAVAAAAGGRRRGRNYRRKSSEQRAMVLTIEEKTSIVAAEADRLKVDKERTEKMLEDARETLRATLEESVNRIKEVKMEMASFKRELSMDRGGISADRALKYMQERPEEQRKHIAKMREKIAQAQQQIAKHMTQLRQREDVGEAFHEIDFSQLEIENQQFLERIEQKNEELVELKGTTTRTVQTLNNLTDTLNTLSSEQQRLRRERGLRQEHVDKLSTEIEQVKKEGAAAQKKNTALKIQHESVKVPKVEDYIAQKAETYELQRAVQNWKRKVEIASGHVAVMKQQILSLQRSARRK